MTAQQIAMVLAVAEAITQKREVSFISDSHGQETGYARTMRAYFRGEKI